MWPFNSLSTRREFDSVWREIAGLKGRWQQVEQEWDATADRVTKVLRRIRRTEQAAEAADEPEVVNGEQSLPLTTLGASGDRLAKIRAQLAAKGR